MNSSLSFPNDCSQPALDSSTWNQRGENLAAMGRYLEALFCFDQVVEQQPDACAAWIFRGVVLIHLERYQEALGSCNRALELQPANSEAWTFRGVALHRLSRFKEAYASYDKALGIQRRSPRKRLWDWLTGA